VHTPFYDLIEFERACGNLPPTTGPCVPDSATKTLRLRLIKEEFQELTEALERDDLVEVADGAADLIYVILGTCVRYGIDASEVWSEVHASNMRKFLGQHPGRKPGEKLRKPPGWQPPRIRALLANQPPLATRYAWLVERLDQQDVERKIEQERKLKP